MSLKSFAKRHGALRLAPRSAALATAALLAVGPVSLPLAAQASAHGHTCAEWNAYQEQRWSERYPDVPYQWHPCPGDDDSDDETTSPQVSTSPITTAPVTTAPVTTPEVSTSPQVSTPPVTTPPVTTPEVSTSPQVSTPPVTTPPVTTPPVTTPPVTTPPVTTPPDTTPETSDPVPTRPDRNDDDETSSTTRTKPTTPTTSSTFEPINRTDPLEVPEAPFTLPSTNTVPPVPTTALPTGDRSSRDGAPQEPAPQSVHNLGNLNRPATPLLPERYENSELATASAHSTPRLDTTRSLDAAEVEANEGIETTLANEGRKETGEEIVPVLAAVGIATFIASGWLRRRNS